MLALPINLTARISKGSEELPRDCRVPVSGIGHSHLGVIVLAMRFVGADGNGIPINKLDGDAAPADTGRRVEMGPYHRNPAPEHLLERLQIHRSLT